MFNLSRTLVLALSVTAVSAYAEDGIITINGKVLDETCTLTGGANTNGGTGQDIVVTLDTVRNNVFSATQKVAGKKSFDLALSNGDGTGACDAVTNASFRGIHITTAASTDYLANNATALINKSTTAAEQSPVYIQLLNDADQEVDYTKPWGTQAASTITTQAGKPTLSYQAQYFTETGVVSGQEVSAVVNYTLQYN